MRAFCGFYGLVTYIMLCFRDDDDDGCVCSGSRRDRKSWNNARVHDKWRTMRDDVGGLGWQGWVGNSYELTKKDSENRVERRFENSIRGFFVRCGFRWVVFAEGVLFQPRSVSLRFPTRRCRTKYTTFGSRKHAFPVSAYNNKHTDKTNVTCYVIRRDDDDDEWHGRPETNG